MPIYQALSLAHWRKHRPAREYLMQLFLTRWGERLMFEQKRSTKHKSPRESFFLEEGELRGCVRWVQETTPTVSATHPSLQQEVVQPHLEVDPLNLNRGWQDNSKANHPRRESKGKYTASLKKPIIINNCRIISRSLRNTVGDKKFNIRK